MRLKLRDLLHKGILALVAITLLLAAGSRVQAANVLVFPQLPAGGDFVVNITLLNTNFDAPVAGVLAVFNQNGTPRSIAIDGRSDASSFQVTIPPGGTVVLNTTPGGPVSVGMAKFTSDFPAGGVVRFQLGDAQVGVLSSPSEAFATVPINTSGGNDTGLAITNSGPSPINLRLVHSDENGQAIETIDPPELNPLAPNAQASKFLREYGFTRIANRSTGSVQIQTKGAGPFNALALLLRGALLSTTAVVPGVTGKIDPEQFHGSFTGSWKNTTFNTSGDAALVIGVVQSTRSILFRLTLGGSVFGSPNAAPTTLFGTYDNNTYTATGDSALFGPVTMTITAEGVWTLTANSVPGPTIATFRITGSAHPDKFTGNYALTFKVGGGATGTITLSHTGQ